MTIDELDAANAAAALREATQKTGDGSDMKDVMSSINVADFFPTSTGALANDAYFPGQPNHLTLQGGNYFNSLPVNTGGQFAVPYGVLDARQMALQKAAYMKQVAVEAQSQRVKNMFPQLSTDPQYESQIQKEYADQVNAKVDALYKQLGPRKAQAALDDIHNPLTEAILQPYNTYESHLRAISQAKAARDAFLAKTQEGKHPSMDAWKAIDDFNSGTLDYNGLSRVTTRLKNVMSFDDYFTKHKGALQADMMSGYQKGLPMIDDFGAPVYQTDPKTHKIMRDVNNQPIQRMITSEAGSDFINEYTKKYMEPAHLAALSDAAYDSGELDPGMTKAEIGRQYLQRLPAEITNAYHEVTFPTATGGSASRAEIQQQQDENDRYKFLTDAITTHPENIKAGLITGKFMNGTITAATVADSPSSNQVSTLQNPFGVLNPEKIVTIKYRTPEMRPTQEDREYTFKINPESGEGIQQLNNMMNQVSEGTKGYIKSEAMSKRFQADPRWHSGTPAAKDDPNDPLHIR